MIPKFIQDFRKKRGQRIAAEDYHKGYRRRAMKSLQLIKRNQGKTLDNTLKNKCDTYAKEILGHDLFAPELYVYSLIQGEFKEGFIPNNYYKSVVIPQLNGDYGKIANMRLLENIIFSKHHSPTIASHSHGGFYDQDYTPLQKTEVKNILFKMGKKVIFKLDTSFKGKGIYIFDRDQFIPSTIENLGIGIFQKFVSQHDFFEEFTPDSVATLRITTTQDGTAGVKGRAAYLRFSLGKDQFIKSNHSLRVAVDIDTGELAPYGYTSDWKKVDKHPDSKTSFGNKRIPEFQAALSLAKELHQKVPFIKCIGWDLTITNQNQVQFMEWNALGNDIDSHEALSGPCFKDLHWESLALDQLVRPYQKIGYY